MAIPSSGPISFGTINTELQRTSNATLRMSDADIRLLAEKPSGVINVSDLRGKSYIYYATISTNVQEINLETWAKFYGWNGVFPAIITINPGVYVWSDNIAVAALATGNFPRGVTIINNGFIMGKGGAGGNGNGENLAGQAGGPAISLGANTIINMSGANSYIGGGGGGGAGSEWGAGGGGAGGGAGGNSYYVGQNGSGFQPGGAGGAIGQSGTDGQEQWGYGQYGRGGSAGGGGGSGLDIEKQTDNSAGGGGGGRIFPGVTTTGNPDGEQPGGPGGAAGVPGGAGADRQGGGGGGWGAAGGNSFNRIGGTAGKAVSLNNYTCTLQGAVNRIYGAVS